MDLHNLEVIVGTYEEFLLGYRIVKEEDEECDLVQSFATHSHRASVRSVATGGKFLASGGTDESIFLYDMSTRKEAGLLMQHNGTISCLEFAPNGSHLLSGSEDGSIGVCRTGSWQLEKLWNKAHKGSAVTSVSIHPSGKLFLSVGLDGTIRTWNFVKGRPAYTTHLCKQKEARSVTQVLWSPDGETYSVAIRNGIEVFNLVGASIVYAIKLDNKVTCICYLNTSILCAASEDGTISLYSIEEKKLVLEFKAHEGRVRSIACFKSKFLISGSSAGQIKVWSIKDPIDVVELCATSTGCRITCMALVEMEMNTVYDEIHSKTLSPVKVELDGEFVENKRYTKSLGIVTVEVDEPKDDSNVHAVDDVNAKKKKKKRQLHKNLNAMHAVNKKHKKKKKDRSVENLSFTVTEDVNDRRQDVTRKSSLNGKIKKKRLKVEEIQVEALHSSHKGISQKTKSCEQVEVLDSHPRKLKKKKKSHLSTVISEPSDKNNVKRKRETNQFQVVDVELGTSVHCGERKRKHSKEAKPDIFEKKFMKSNMSSKHDHVTSASGEWIIE